MFKFAVLWGVFAFNELVQNTATPRWCWRPIRRPIPAKEHRTSITNIKDTPCGISEYITGSTLLCHLTLSRLARAKRQLRCRSWIPPNVSVVSICSKSPVTKQCYDFQSVLPGVFGSYLCSARPLWVFQFPTPWRDIRQWTIVVWKVEWPRANLSVSRLAEFIVAGGTIFVFENYLTCVI